MGKCGFQKFYKQDDVHMRRIFEIMYKELVLMLRSMLRNVTVRYVKGQYLFLSCHPETTGEHMDPSQPF